MKYREMKQGRVFVLRLEDGDSLPRTVEEFAKTHQVRSALVAAVGGIEGGRIVVGPEKTDVSEGVTPMIHVLEGVHEAAAVGTLFHNEAGEPALHMHAALGRGGATRTGCVRTGVEVWKVLEVVILELTGGEPLRKRDAATGFELLEP